MAKTETLEYWKPIIDGYQKDKETVKEYCQRLGICNRMFYHYRLALYGPSENYRCSEVKLLPVVIEEDDAGSTSVRINSVDLKFSDRSISDEQLSRIIRLCRDL